MQHTRLVETKAASWTITAADSGKTYIINGGASVVATLPSTANGLHYRFIIRAVAASGVGFSISPAAADSINAGTDDKDLINSAATDAVGDSVEIWGDGDIGWFASINAGTWAAEAP